MCVSPFTEKKLHRRHCLKLNFHLTFRLPLAAIIRSWNFSLGEILISTKIAVAKVSGIDTKTNMAPDSNDSSDIEDDDLLLLIVLRNKRRNKYKKRFWVRQTYQERKQKGEYLLLVQDLKLFDHELFFTYFRMTPAKFEELLSWVASLITKSSIRREPICPSERLCATLRYLVTGDAQVTISMSYRISQTTIGRI